MEYVIAVVLITIFIYVIRNVGAAYEESFRLHMRTASLRSYHIEDNLVLNGYANRYQFVINGSKKLVRIKQNNQTLEIPFENIIKADLIQGDDKELPKASSISICIHLRSMNTPSLTIYCYQGPCYIQSSNSGTEDEKYRESLEKAQELMKVIHYIMNDNKRNLVNSSTQASSYTSCSNNLSGI